MHTRDKKNPKQTLSCNSGAQHSLRKLLSDTSPGEKSLLGTRKDRWDHFSSYFSASIKRGGYGKGGGASELEILLQRSRLFHGKFFGSGGRANLQLSRPDVFLVTSLNASNECFIWFYVAGAFFSTVLEGSFWSCWNSDNEGIQEDPAGIGREAQNKKSLGGLREKFEALRRFSQTCRVWKRIRNLMRKSSSSGVLGNRITEAPELKETSVLHS